MAKTTRTFIVVDGTETLLTNALMMERAIAALRAVGEEQAVIDKAVAHLAALTKKSDTPKQPSKAAVDNKRLSLQVYGVMPLGEAVTTSWVMQHVRDIMTVSKCAQVMSLLTTGDNPAVVKSKDGRHVTYTRVQ